MDKTHLRKVLNWDACKECGQCLANCRYIHLPASDAVREIKNLNQGNTSFILENCISCYACNTFCPNNAHPYERILFAMKERYDTDGLPKRASYLLPGRRPNFREDLTYDPAEKALHTRWNTDTPPAKTVLYPGCNLLSMPLLATGKVFEKLPVWGRWDLCCGEMYFRTGLLDKAEETAHKLTRFYSTKDIKEMVFVCPACYNMFTIVLPQQFGARFNFKTTFFTDWFLQEIENGTFDIKETLTGSVVIHDSCHGRILGNSFMEKQRQLLKRLGLEVNETQLNRDKGLCCGMAAGAKKFSVMDLIKNAMRQLIALDRSKGKETAIYCTGCLLMFSTVRPLRPFGKKMRHFLEYIRKALGEDVTRKNTPRALSIFKGITLHSVPFYFSSKKIKL